MKLLVVLGPTASGKTKLGIELAKELNGEIVSADSMQIYQEMDIGTAKPTLDEMQGIPHHCISFIRPDQEYSVAEYVKDANRIIQEIAERRKQPILVGGTGLYIDSLCSNTQFSPAYRDEALRKKLMEQAEQSGNDTIYQRLCKIDPAAAEKIHVNDTKRIVRALEIYELSGVPMSEHDKKSKQVPPAFETVKIGLTGERDQLYSRINQRVEEMLNAGLAEEVNRLLQGGLSKDAQSMQAIGYKEVFYYLHGLCGYEEMKELLKRNTRRYAKRQMTWFRRDTSIWWLRMGEKPDIEKIRQKLNASI